MSVNQVNGRELNPEIAALLDSDDPPAPEFSKILETSNNLTSKREDTNSGRQSFPSIEKWEQEPNPIFFDKDFYSRVLKGEGEYSKKIHALLQKFFKAEDPQEKGVFRQRLIPLWWDLLRSISTHFQNSSQEKRWAIRYAYFLPTLVSTEQQQMLSRIIATNNYDEPIHYVDEWFALILSKKENPLATDELKFSQMNVKTKTRLQLDKAMGSKEANLKLLNELVLARKSLNTDLQTHIRVITRHNTHPTIPDLQSPYTAEQKLSFNQINEILRKLNKLDREINLNIERFKDADNKFEKLDDKIQQMGELDKVDESVMGNELDSVRQLAKMCVGRRGNHLPFLIKSFFSSNITLIGTRENIINCMSQVEQLDPGVFRRSFRQRSHRIVPHTIIVPCFGDRGICWEPFDQFNRATSRGRIAVPMYPKDIKTAVIYALGDLRWNIAKERAAHYWMEEGLTGNYYQWFSGTKQRGDVRGSFLDNYFLWITKESEGVQKLEKGVRAIFWRCIPFPQAIKDSLKNRGFVYNELHKKDVNRELSDGY